MTTVEHPPEPGDIVGGRYVIDRPIGCGSFGAVYSALVRGTRQKVAIKFILPRMLDKTNIIERFAREARLMSALKTAHSVEIYACGIFRRTKGSEGLPYIVMEHLFGIDVAAYTRLVGPTLPLEEALAITLGALDGLAESHKLGIIHRDIKPANLFIHRGLKGGNQMKILDFGVAKAIGEAWSKDENNMTGIGMILGTPAYMAPEQSSGSSALTTSADVYAVGCVAYTLITGGLPYRSRSPVLMAMMHERERTPRLDLGRACADISEVVAVAMGKLPRARFEDAGAFARALRSAIACSPVQPRLPVHLPQLSSPPVIAYQDVSASRASFEDTAMICRV